MKKFNHLLSITLLAIILSLSVNSMGQNPFEIEIIQPNNADIDWIKGHSYTISWLDNLTQPVNIFLVNDVLAPAIDTKINATPVVGTTWVWDIDPATIASPGYKIRVESSVSAATYNATGATFDIVNSLPGSIEVLQPNVTGIDWAWNTTNVISWTDNVAEALDVYLVNSVTGFEEKLNTTPIVGSTFDWEMSTTPGGNPAEDGNYKIRVQSYLYSDVKDLSNAIFSISQTTGTFQEIYQPTAASVWAKGTKHLISWRDDFNDAVNIYYTIGAVETLITTTPVFGSTYVWTTPTTIGTYTIRIASSADDDIDIVSSAFSIIETTGEISAIYQPLTTASWTLGTTHLISWLDNLDEPVDVYYRNWDPTPGGAHWDPYVLIEGNVVGTTVAWDIPTTLYPGVNYGQIKIASSIDGTVLKESEFFDLKLTQGTYIDLIQPNVAGISWADGYDYYISWDDDLIDAEFVDIHLCGYNSGGGFAIGDEFDTEEISLDNIGSTYVWTAGDEGIVGAESYRIKIVSSDNPAIVGYSTETFNISLSLGTFVTVENPTVGVYWMNNTDKYISWLDNCPENVWIYLDEYEADGTTPWTTPTYEIVVGAGAPGSMYSWYLDQATLTPGNRFKIRVVSKLDPTGIIGESELFYIVPFGKSALSIDNGIAANVTMYPNPTSGQFTINAPVDITRVEVRNLLGQVVYTGDVTATQANIDISNYDAGIYIVNVIVNEEVVTKKLFVQ